MPFGNGTLLVNAHSSVPFPHATSLQKRTKIGPDSESLCKRYGSNRNFSRSDRNRAVTGLNVIELSALQQNEQIPLLNGWRQPAATRLRNSGPREAFRPRRSR